MKYFKSENGIVIQVICNPREGFIETEDNVVPGMLFNGETFTNPEPQGETVQQQIDDLENSVTKRNYREYLKGIREPTNPDYKYSTDKIDKVDAQINALRP